MALSKSFENEWGGKVKYWRVLPSIHVDFAGKVAVASLVVYIDADARTAEKRPYPWRALFHGPEAESIQAALTLSGAAFDAALASGDLRAAIYARVKALPAFADAVDC